MRLLISISIVLGIYANALGQASIKSYTYDPSVNVGFTTTQYQAWMYTRTVGGSVQQLPFRMLQPVNYNLVSNKSKQYPLVIMLHGRGEAGSDNQLQLTHGGLPHLNAVNNAANPSYVGPRQFDGFVVFPQEPYGQWTNNYQFAWPQGQMTTALEQVLDLVDSLKIKYRIDPDRVIVHGLSSGGTGTWACLYNRPDLFATALPMSTQGDLTQMGKLAPIPIWLFQGELDTNPIPYIATQVMQALRDSGAVDTNITRYTLCQTCGHDTWDTAYAEPDFFPYMLRYTKRMITVLGKNPFCPNEPTTLSISVGYSGYQWFGNGVLLAGQTKNRLENIITPGTYYVRYKRDSTNTGYIYSDTVTVTQEIAGTKPVVSSHQSLILPSPSATSDTLSIPYSSYNQYQWTNGATTSQIVTNMSGVYRVRVRPAGACWSAYSDSIVIQSGGMGTPVPAMPTSLSAIPLSPISVSFSWKDTITHVTGYEIYRASKATGPYSFIALVGANSTSYIDNSVTPSTSYYYKVRAVNKVAATLSNTYAFVETFKDLTIPSIPQNLTLYAITANGLTLSWNKSQEQYPIKTYIIYNGSSIIGYSTDTSFLYTQLTTGTNYAFSVQAEDYSGNLSGIGNIATFSYSGQGLFAGFYEGAWSNLPNFNLLTPVTQGLVTQPALPTSNLLTNVLNGTNLPTVSTNFGLSFTGYVYISNAGKWTFYTGSDDGSALYINNTLVVNNDFLQGYTERSGTYTFSQSGWYPITVNYFQSGGGLQLTASYQGPSNNPAKAAIPTYYLATTNQGITAPPSTSLITSNFAGLVATNVTPVDKIRVNLALNFNGAPSSSIGGFEIYRIASTTAPTSTSAWQQIATVPLTTTASTITYVDTITSPGVFLKPNTQYFYAVKIYGDYLSNSFFYNPSINPTHSPAVCATTGNITLSGTQTIDGVAVVAGNRVLVKNQTIPSQNGIYDCASGVWTRDGNENTGGLLQNAILTVTGGTVNKGIWTCINATIAGMGTANVKANVLCATTANITLKNTQKIDGITLVAGNRVLVKNQSTASQNGIYVCASGNWTRSTDASDGSSTSTGLLGATFVVTSGATQAGTWVCSNNLGSTITIGTTSISFVQPSNINFDRTFITTPNVTIASPAAPSNLVVTGLTNTVIQGTFTDNSTNESGFQVWRSQDKVDYALVDIVPANTTLFYDSTGVANTKYYYKLRAFNANATPSAYSNVDSTTTLNIPTAPSNLVATVVGPKQVNLTWQNNSISNGFGFSIYRSTSRKSGYVNIDSVPNPNMTFYQDTSVALTQKYYYKVRAYNANVSAFSNIDSTTIFTAVIPSFSNWKMPLKAVVTNFKTNAVAPFVASNYTAFNANISKLTSDLMSKNDFLRYLYINKNDTGSFSVHLPVKDSIKYGGLITFNVSLLGSNSILDSAQLLDENFPSDGTYLLNVYTSTDNVTYTLMSTQPWTFNYSNMLQKMDIDTSLANTWVKFEFISSSTNSNYGGIFLTEIGAYRFLGPGIRHNYFLLCGASIERPNLPMGMIQFRKRLNNSSDLKTYGKNALVFNLSFPGSSSSYLSDSINTYMSRHPYASYVVVHQGGNDINYSGNGLRPLTYASLETLSGVKTLIGNFTNIIQSIQNGGKIPFVSRLSFRDYKDVCPNTGLMPPDNPTYNGPGVYKGRNQENGSLPYNLVIDSLTQVLTPFAYNNSEKRSSINYYPVMLNEQVILGPDGIHPSSVPKCSAPGGCGSSSPYSYTNSNVDTCTDYWINYVMRYVYTGKFAAPIIYNCDNQLAYPPYTGYVPQCNINPANKPNLLALTDSAVLKAERTKAGVDIWNARILVEQLGDKSIRVPYVLILDSLNDYRSPANPTSLSSTIVNATTVTLNWQDNDLIATGYQIWESSNGGVTYKLVTTLPANSTTYTLSNLSGDTLYSFYVRATNGTFKSGYSNIVSVRPSSTYYSKATGNLENTSTWGLNTDGSGASPSNFTASGQVFVYSNRPNLTTLTNPWKVSGNYSKIVISAGAMLTINNGVNLNASLDLMPNTQLTVNSSFVPTLLNIDSTSTLIFTNSDSLKNSSYGNLQLTTTGSKTFTNNTVTIKGNLSLSSHVVVTGNPTTINLKGDLLYTDTLPVLQNITLILNKKSQQIDAKGGTIQLNQLVTPDSSYVTILNASTLKLGSASGGGFSPGINSFLDIGNGNINITGKGALNPTNNGSQIGANNGSLYLNTSTTQNSYLNPSPSELTFQNITNYNNGGATLFLLDSMNLTGTLKLGNGQFKTNNHLVLVSNQFGTARIAKVEAGATLLDSVIWQRLVGSFKSQSVYFLGSPIKNKRIAEFEKYFTVTGFKTGQSASIANWNEPTNGWVGVRDSNTIVTPGLGFRTLIRTQDLVYINNSGFYQFFGLPVIGDGNGNNTSPFVIPLSHSVNGWNVIANPYPCEIDWDATVGWDKTNIDNSYYVWDGNNRSYKVYKGPGGTGLVGISTQNMTSVINAGQGFMVKSVTPGSSTISMTEDVKTADTDQPPFYRLANVNPDLRITFRNTVNADQAIIRFYQDASVGYDIPYDALKYMGTNLNVSSLEGTDEMTINTLPYYNTNVVVPLHVQTYTSGTFTLDFTDTETFPQQTQIYLYDIAKDSTMDVRANVSYTFDSSGTFDVSNRFQVLFNNLPIDEVLGFEQNNNVLQGLHVYPNPSEGNTTFQLNMKNGSNVSLTIYNAAGLSVYANSTYCQSGSSYVSWVTNKQSNSSGIYFYKLTTNDQDYSGKVVIY